MNILKLSTLSLLASLCLTSSAQTAEFRSTYSETLTCPVTEEAADAFIRECIGPGNVRAVLQYVDGLFGVFYLPMGGDTPLQLADMLEISPNARLPYGAKLEWRQRIGEPAPCVAIIRAYTTRGEFLVLNELVTGRRIAKVRTNQQARTVADRVCGKAATSVASAESKIVPSSKPEAPSSENSSLASAARNGRERVLRVFTQVGISGVIEEVEQCYSDFDRYPSLAKLAECAAIDFTGADADRPVMGGMPDLRQSFFAKDGPSGRIAASMDKLGLDEKARQTFNDEIEASISMSVVAPRPTIKESESVFDFSQ
ncbi:hypothetical protein PZ897_14315 [Hoeflea sp. YIM 152468]|uniref:hypothetical protein n=1 Tax=Hoeflea sp. YIM 152468 TaxID=3031759 RepID=UPI0023DAF1A1|nr:hypothetical protein [Hoeflea sp. YIM 152468]MDF1609357.1 hypothetical protein [Hoeflea sp. YIM 152468]